jgi:hypothetical protein
VALYFGVIYETFTSRKRTFAPYDHEQAKESAEIPGIIARISQSCSTRYCPQRTGVLTTKWPFLLENEMKYACFTDRSYPKCAILVREDGYYLALPLIFSNEEQANFYARISRWYGDVQGWDSDIGELLFDGEYDD